MSNYNWLTIKETNEWIVDYSPTNGRYRVSYFEDGHFKDEVIFREHSADKNIENTDVFIAGPHCFVNSIKLSTDEYAQIEAGQQLIETCRVCDRVVCINEA